MHVHMENGLPRTFAHIDADIETVGMELFRDNVFDLIEKCKNSRFFFFR